MNTAKTKKILLLTDNGILFDRFRKMIDAEFVPYRCLFDYRKSGPSRIEKLYETGLEHLMEISVKEEIDFIMANYNLIISLHCKQIFPKTLVDRVRCVNVHPGYNPHNRGWYPQVFAILERTLIGATIHQMDEHLDHGPIICRDTVSIEPTDTSKDVYEKILDLEIELLRRHLPAIVENTYRPLSPEFEGVAHTRDEFLELCRLDMDESLTMRDAIDRLRALTHGSYANAYYEDQKGKIYVRISLSR